MKTFFTSDRHFGHGNIIDYCCRPFTDRGDMNDTMITAHNAVVGPDDLVVDVGDFCFGSGNYVDSIIQRLNGRETILIQGNHDRRLAIFRQAGWRVHSQLVITLYEDLGWNPMGYGEDDKLVDPSKSVHIYLRHKPQKDKERWLGAEYHLHGHSHGRHPHSNSKIIDVGVDCWGYVPRTWEEIRDSVFTNTDSVP